MAVALQVKMCAILLILLVIEFKSAVRCATSNIVLIFQILFITELFFVNEVISGVFLVVYLLVVQLLRAADY